MKALIVVAIIILFSLLACQALSSYQAVNILNSGNISYMLGGGVSSQMRGVFIAQQSLSSPDFTTIANNLATYGINLVSIEILKNYEACYQSVYVPLTVFPAINFAQCIATFHAKGIQVYAHFDTMYKSYSGDGISRVAWYLPSGGNLSSIQPYFGNNGWLDIANPYAVSLIHNLITELVTNYNIDGITFDYTRWDDYMPLGNCSSGAVNYDKLQFIADTGLSNVTWPNDVVPVANGGTGLYLNLFREWRTNLVNTLVRNMTQWALAINPNLEFGASPHGYGRGGLGPAYWCYRDGQDVNYWISQGYIQWVAPMIYSNVTSDYSGCVQAFEGNATGGPHGLIPICPFISNQFTSEGAVNLTTADITRQVNAILSAGGDGWIIWEYGGPGDGKNSGSPDITPYLAALGLPNPATFILGNVTLQTLNSTAEQVSWTTTSAANSSVEYSPSPLYTWALAHDTQSNFNYWKITHVSGTLTANSALTTTHTVIITGLTVPLYIHIMSGDPSGTATVYKFYR